jgi:subtilisin family serine protease
MGKYVVIKDLVNIRNHPSIRDENFVGTLKMGEVVDLIDEPVAGEIPAGTDDNMWHGDLLNRFISRPAVAPAETYAAKKAAFIADTFNERFIDADDKENEAKWKVSWGHVDLEIWRIWKEYKTMGEGVKVAVIDTGVHFSGNDLKNQIKKNQVFVGTSIEDEEPYHGTKSTGVIAANGKFSNTVYGIAPNCELFFYKAANASFDYSTVILALQQALKDGVQIISMSFSCQQNSTLEKWINFCKKRNIFLLVSAGDTNTNTKLYPASFNDCFSVGAYYVTDIGREIFKEKSNHNDAVSFLSPGKDILTTSITNKPTLHQETSAAAAFSSGIMALILSINPSLTVDLFKELLIRNEITKSIEKTTPRSDFEGYGVLMPSMILNYFNNQNQQL